MELNKNDAALIIREDMSIEFEIPKQEDDENVRPNSYLVATLAIFLQHGQEFIDFLEKKQNEIPEKFKNIKQ